MATVSGGGRRRVNRHPSSGAYLNLSRPPFSRLLLFSFSSFFFIMHSHWYPIQDPLADFTPILRHTAANMSNDAISLETFRPATTATKDPDTSHFLRALHQGSRSPPDAHPPDNVNHAQSSQEVVRMPSPRLHGAEGAAGSQRKSISFMLSLVRVVFISSWCLFRLRFPFLSFPSRFLVIFVKHPLRVLGPAKISLSSRLLHVFEFHDSVSMPTIPSTSHWLPLTSCFDHPRFANYRIPCQPRRLSPAGGGGTSRIRTTTGPRSDGLRNNAPLVASASARGARRSAAEKSVGGGGVQSWRAWVSC